MANPNTGEDSRTHALIISPKSGKNAEVAAYTIDDGSLLISNANIRPFSFLDGAHLQRLNSNAAELTTKYIKKHMVSVGTCESCDSDLVASASLADAIETAGKEIHCPMCSTAMAPTINNNQLIAALASEYDDSDDDYADDDSDANSEDDGEDTDTSDDDSDNSDDDYSDDDSDSGSDDDYSDDDDDSNSDDDYAGDDNSEDEDKEMSAAVASLKERISEMAMDDDGSDDAEVMDDSDTDCDDSEDSEGGEDPIPDDTVDEDGGEGEEDEDGGVPYDDVYDDDDMESATAAFKKVVAHKLGQLPVAGKGVDRSDIETMNERARDTVRDRRGNKVDGNAYMKGGNAVATEEENKEKAAEGQEKTPGTHEVPGEMNKQVDTPGTEKKVAGEMNKQPETPGTEVSGDIIVDWTNSKIELVATSDKSSLWVFANNIPVGKIVKEKASTGVQTRWNEAASLQNAFVAVAKRGFTAAEAAEFGFEAQNFKVDGEQVIRKAMARQSLLATEKAKKEVANAVDGYKQSVKSAMVSAFKGIYSDLANPLRDQLVASLSAISVAEPRNIVDTAFAKASEKLLVAVFTKADEIAGKSTEVRNEIASYVANANYQSRISEGTDLAAKLAKNNNDMIVARTYAADDNKNSNDYTNRLNLALSSIIK